MEQGANAVLSLPVRRSEVIDLGGPSQRCDGD
ncbi:hypothetical protein Y699_07583 [Aspergillus fumigatus Z5]|nr:hypothetical protein Y699_07583 [Aspergillus fumigatus Z5]